MSCCYLFAAFSLKRNPLDDFERGSQVGHRHQLREWEVSAGRLEWRQ